MKKKFLKTLLMLIILTIILSNICLGYEDELFKFDLPSTFANMSYQNMYIFGDTTGRTERGFIIYAQENDEMKKSVWDVDDDDLDDIIRSLSYGSNIIEKNKRAKLGKERAIQIILYESGTYIELYILASNNYIYIVTFIGESEADLENSDYKMIKDSFELKDATTNFKVIFIIGFIIIILIIFYLSARRRPKHLQYTNPSNQIDYKNMTEDDFNLRR